MNSTELDKLEVYIVGLIFMRHKQKQNSVKKLKSPETKKTLGQVSLATGMSSSVVSLNYWLALDLLQKVAKNAQN